MLADFFNINAFFRGISNYAWWQIALELLLIGLVVYWVVRFLRGTRGARMLRGIAFVLISLYLIVGLLAEQLGLGPEELVTCGMSCGYSDEQAAVNRLNMPREPLDGFTRWLGFDE